MRVDWVRAETSAGRIALDPSIGNIRQLDFHSGGRWLSPLHTAPWADDPDLVAGDSVPLVEAKLAGDFLCAPFGAGGVDGSPPHGWTANSPWSVQEQSRGRLRLRLDRPVMGARVTKVLAVAADAPLLYQVHVIEGGAGAIPVAHHPMIHLAGRGALSVSPKRAALSSGHALEPGRNRLAPDQRVTDMSRFPSSDGAVVDLGALPIGDSHEDFVTLVEAAGAEIGWAALVREVEDDIVFFLKDPDVLPITMLWYSNGGRDYAPWSGRHRGVLGIEDGCTAGADGHAAALGPNRVAAEDVPTALPLGGRLRIAHVTGAVPRPAGWTRIAAMNSDTGQLTLQDIGGGSLSLPFDTDFLKKGP